MLMIKKIKQLGWIGAICGFLFALSVYVLLDDTLKMRLRGAISSPDRIVLSVATGPVIPEGDARVVKIKTPKGLIVEVYGPIHNTSMMEHLIDTIQLNAPHDSQIQFQGRASNLALKDMTGDRLYEIIVPVYERDLTPRLSVFTYNASLKRFVPHHE
jgi:hypothetical protein